MYTLFISTFRELIEIALLKDGKMITKKEQISNRNHSIYTVPLIEEILKDTVNRLHEYDPTEGLQEGEMKITIESADGNPVISQFSQSELSSTGQMMLNKMKSTLGNFGGSISYEEKIAIVAQILKEIIN